MRAGPLSFVVALNRLLACSPAWVIAQAARCLILAPVIETTMAGIGSLNAAQHEFVYADFMCFA
jgi:hypothetical protein